MTESPGSNRARNGRRLVAGVVSGLAVALGSLVILAVVALGSCGAFGGTCPEEAPPLFDDEVFRFSVLGAAIAVGIPLIAFRPARMGLAKVVAVAAATALMVGLAARSFAHG